MSELAVTEQTAGTAFFTRLKQRFLTNTRSRYSDFLPEAQAIAAREASPVARVLVFVIAALFAILLFWAGYSEVEQVATAPAVVRPAGKVKIVNHPDGGRVAAIHIREGERVVAGQKLIEFDRGGAREEIARRAAAWHALIGEAARLTAEATGAALDFPAALIEARPDIVRSQTRLYKTRHRALSSRRDIAEKVIEQRDREAGGLAVRLEQLAQSLEILAEQEKAIGELAGKGYFPRLRHLSIKRQISELKGQISETEEGALGAFSALAEARTRRASIDDEWRSEALGRLAEVRREAEIGLSALSQERRRRHNLILRAPTAGVIQNLTVTAP
ncbi:MAG: hypothetical protein ACTSQV_03130, partial [Alphaproteobacteria bacterium]